MPGVDAVAPCVGRIADWGHGHSYDGDLGVETIKDPELLTQVPIPDQVTISDQVMVAGFRNIGEASQVTVVEPLTAFSSHLKGRHGTRRRHDAVVGWGNR